MYEQLINTTSNGLTVAAFASTLLYTTLGLLIMLVAVWVINTAFKLNIKRELSKENNVAYGVAIAGFAIAIAIIIGATISS
jgi:putative membrane protein